MDWKVGASGTAWLSGHFLKHPLPRESSKNLKCYCWERILVLAPNMCFVFHRRKNKEGQREDGVSR